MLVETRRHGGTQPPEWSRRDRHPVLPTLAANAADEGASSGSTRVTATSGSGTGGRGGSRAGGNHGHRQVGGGGGAGGGGAPSSRPGTACCEIVVLVDGLTPRTYYSFRASAVNARGAGDPGPPCRRVRTAAPSPPSWAVGHNVVKPPPPGEKTAQASAGKTESGGPGGGGVATAGTQLTCAPPRAACSGLGACTVLWEEPFSNGSVIELYEVEVVRIGPDVMGKGVGTTAKDKEGNDAVHDDNVNGNTGHDSNPTKGRISDRAGEERQPGGLGLMSLSMPEKKQTEEAADEAAVAESPPPPPELVSLPIPEREGRRRGGEGGRGEVVREVKQRFTRSVPSRMRHLVVRGLATRGDYVFRVRASNVAGMGEAGPWTQVVRVVDPADEDSP